ncbi:MAG: hypothetical protein IPL59_23640 [Candidatus Competibacteraceae bacterium]|nr:hypothetical protein [Candidatus Competibacteraceae bacterium]
MMANVRSNIASSSFNDDAGGAHPGNANDGMLRREQLTPRVGVDDGARGYGYVGVPTGSPFKVLS